MMNVMEINGYRAVVQYDPDIGLNQWVADILDESLHVH